MSRVGTWHQIYIFHVRIMSICFVTFQAIVLCEYLESNPSVVQGKDVLELGAGTGLVGMVSGLLG